jgi:rare lipoprotein A
MSKKIRNSLFACLLLPVVVFGRDGKVSRDSIPVQGGETRGGSQVPGAKGAHRKESHRKEPIKVQYGVASYYANKFEGRKTYTDEIFCQDSLTAASNTLPMHTWIRVTNLRNKRSVIVQINDKMHPRNRRLIDLSRAAAAQIGFAGRGLTRVRIDVLGKKRPAGTEQSGGAEREAPARGTGG